MANDGVSLGEAIGFDPFSPADAPASPGYELGEPLNLDPFGKKRTLTERAGSTVKAIGQELWDAVAYHLPASVASAVEGDQPFDGEKDWKDSLIERSRARTQERTKGRYDREVMDGVDGLGQSLGFSAVGMATGLGTGLGVGAATSAAATPVAGAVAGWTSGTAASGVAAYRMATNNFVRDLREAADRESVRKTGKPMSDEAFADKAKELSPLIQEYGLWEAIPEAASNAATAGIGKFVFKPAAKEAIGGIFGKSVLARLGVGTAAELGEELATETVTQIGQHKVEYDTGLYPHKDRMLGVGEALSEVAPQTVLQTLLLSGGAGSVHYAKGKFFPSETKPGVRDDAKSDAEQSLSDADRASPIPDDMIAAGKAEMADIGAKKEADAILSAAGIPATDSRVSVSMGQGPAFTGVISDVFKEVSQQAPSIPNGAEVLHDEAGNPIGHFNPATGETFTGKPVETVRHGVTITMDNGKTLQLFLDDMPSSGINVSPILALENGRSERPALSAPAAPNGARQTHGAGFTMSDSQGQPMGALPSPLPRGMEMANGFSYARDSADPSRVESTQGEQFRGVDRQAESIRVVNDWQRQNRTTWNEDLMGGAAESNPAFNGAHSIGGGDIQAHGMAKSSPAKAIKDLFALFRDGINPSRKFYTDRLTNDPGAGAGTGTAGGHAYRDGPFILLGHAGREIKSVRDIAAVLVNPALDGAIESIRAALPGITVASYSDVARVVSDLKSQTAPVSVSSEQTSETQTPVSDAGETQLISRKDGTPFPDRKTAANAIKLRADLKGRAFDIVPFNGGFALKEKAVDATPKKAAPTIGPKDAIRFLAERGGLRDDEGHDLRTAYEGRKIFVPKAGPLLRQSGMSVDEAGAALWDAGYFGPTETTPRPSQQQVLDFLDSATQAAQYSEEDRAAVDAKNAEAEQKDHDAAVKAAKDEVKGHPASGRMTAEEINDAARAMLEQGMDMEDAVVHVMDGNMLAWENDAAQLAVRQEDTNHDFDIPFLDDGRAAGGTRQEASAPGGVSEGPAGRPEGGSPQAGEGGRTDQSAPQKEDLRDVEIGDAIGVTASTENTTTKAQELAKLKGKQTKLRKGNQQEPGGMFAAAAEKDQGDLLEGLAAKPAAQKKSEVRDPASWVIRDKITGETIMETFDRKKVDALNADRYEAVPIKDHLVGFNRQTRIADLNAEIANLDAASDADPFVVAEKLLAAKEALAAQLAQEPGGLVLVQPHYKKGVGDLGAQITPEPDGSGRWRITYFDKNGFSGDAPRGSKEAAINDALDNGYRDTNRNLLREYTKLDSFDKGNESTDKIRKINEELAAKSEQNKDAFDQGFDAGLDDVFGKENGDVLDSGGNLEQDRGGANASDGLGARDVRDGSGRTGRGHGGGVQGDAGRGDQSGRGPVVSNDGSAPVGENGDSEVRGDAPGSDQRAPERGKRKGGGGDSPAGSSSGRGRKPATARNATKRTALEAGKSAVKNTVESADEAMAALVQLFGGGKTIGSGLAFDPDTYAKAKPLFISAARKFSAAIKDVAEMARLMVKEMAERFGMTRQVLENMRQYMRRFVEDVQAGHIDLSDSELKVAQESKAATKSFADALAAQERANSIKVVPNDADNIRATLPFLREEQQNDVIKAEARFDKPDGHGMLFTNGTGTGKTYTGGGIVARFTRQGKGEILIVAPSQDILNDWKRSLENLNVRASVLESTKSAGRGVTLTTYANLGENANLADRKWDLVVADESQKLMQAKEGDETTALKTFRAITNHPRGYRDRAKMELRDLWGRIEALTSIKLRDRTQRQDDELARLNAEFEPKAKALVEKYKGQSRSKAVFLSATPFAYVKAIDYAEGYLFDYPKAEGNAYNSGDGREQFFMQHFGYRMRYNKLTAPDASVNVEVMEREFHEHLKRQGVLSGRALDVDADYDRKFMLVDDAVGNKIDAALEFLQEADGGRFRPILDAVNEQFDYLSRMRLLEAIKAHHAIPYIREQVAMGRRVVVFHDYNEGGGISPFDLSFEEGAKGYVYIDGKTVEVELEPLYQEFLDRNPEAAKLDFSDMKAPMYTLQEAFPDALIYNGKVANKKRAEAKVLFNLDGKAGRDLIIINSAAGEAGISLHDTTGKHQRVLLNLGMPVRPTTAIQEEGRIYRVGQVTDAIFRYMNTGTTWERSTFAGKIAERASTAENLALGNQARTLKASFINAFMESDVYEPSQDEGKGGKAMDRRDGKEMTLFERAKTFYAAQQKKRGKRDQREGLDYYATPEPIGMKMVEFANLKAGEKVLEPSAGHGAIARWFPESAERTIIEPSAYLATKAALASPGAKMLVERFEDLHINNKYDAIVMNPPYGAGSKLAFEHMEQAVKHLRNGGRIVALIPEGGMSSKRLEKFLFDEGAPGEAMHMVADISLPSVTFEKAGTGVKTHIIVLEKQTDADVAERIQSVERDYSSAKTINELFDMIEHAEVPARLEPITKEAEPVQVDEKGNATVTAGGVTLRLSKDGPDFVAKPVGRLGNDFRRVVDAAEKNGGEYLRSLSAFLFGSAEQRQAFIEALDRPAEAVAPAPASGMVFELSGFTHTKTGEQLFRANALKRVDRDAYQVMADTAKRFGGNWSSFAKGFLFKTEAARAEFVKAMTTAEKLRVTPAAEITPARIAALEPVLRKRLEAVGLDGKVALRVVDTIRSMVTGEAKRGAAGMYHERVIQVAAGGSNPMLSLNHEIIHALRDMNILRGLDWKSLEKMAANDKAVMSYVEQHYSHLSRSEQLEEAVAEMFGKWADSKPAAGFVGKAYERVAAFFKALASSLRNGGLSDALAASRAVGVMQDVNSGRMRDVESGRFVAGEKEQASYPQFKPVDTSSPEFKRWFGDSKVVDDQGKPLVVYHGTPSAAGEDFAFDPEKKGITTFIGIPVDTQRHGFFFAEDKSFADSFANQELGKGSGTTLPVYLSIQNPLIMPAEGLSNADLEKLSEQGVDRGWLLNHAGDPNSTWEQFDDENGAFFSSAIRSAGYDGVKMQEVDPDTGAVKDVWIAFSPTQIKSAVSNTGAFSSTDPRIKYRVDTEITDAPISFSQPQRSVVEKLKYTNGSLMTRIKAAATKEAISESLDRWRTAMQDQFLPLLRTEAAIERMLGRQLTEAERPYLTQELSTGRKGAQLEDLSEDMVKPLFASMHAEGVNVDELESYLYARHAPERNARISEINPNFEEGTGSGMTDDEAAAIMAAIEKAGKMDAMKRLAKRVDAITKFALDTRVAAGLMTEEEAKSWRDRYRHYVPLRGEAELDPELSADRPRSGSGVNVRGPESKMAFGRESRANDILAYTIMQAEEAILRAETNKIGQAFHELAKSAPDSEFWTVDKVEKRAVFNKARGVVEYRPVRQITAEDKDYTVSLKIDGVEHRVTMNRKNPEAVRLADSMRNLSAEKMNWFVSTAGKLNRYLSTVNTSLNPEFVITNAFRDLGHSIPTLAQHDIPGLIRKVLKDYPAALKGAMRGSFGKHDGQWTAYYDEFREAGGRVYFNRMEDINELRARVEKDFRDAKPGLTAKKAIVGVFKFIETVNQGVESAIRLSAYKNAREAGMSVAQAASLAKNLTVNFNRRGTYGPMINSLYLFYNASVQGTTGIFMAAKHPRVQKMLFAAVMAGAALEFINAMASDDDDDKEKFYDKIPDYDKSRNLIVMLPGSGGRYIKIPLPYGYNVFFGAGRTVAALARGLPPGKTIGGFGSAVADAFNPIGSGGSFLNVIAPTVADPFVDLALNRNFAGKPIKPEDAKFAKVKKPESQQYWGSVNPLWRNITDALNSVTGGDKVKPGVIDVSPEVLEYSWGVVTGGAGAFLSRSFGLAAKLGDPTSEVGWNDVPFARRLVGGAPSWQNKSMFYERIGEIEQARGYAKSYLERGDRESAKAQMDGEKDLIGLYPAAESARTSLGKIGHAKAELSKAKDMGKITDSQYAERMMAIKEREKAIITNFNRMYVERMSAQ